MEPPLEEAECSAHIECVPAVGRCGGGYNLLAWVWSIGPLLLLIPAGRGRENVLISASPSAQKLPRRKRGERWEGAKYQE